jgi:hypothetical protein
MHERTSILAALDAALRGAPANVPDGSAQLRKWHDAAHASYLTDAEKHDVPPILHRAHIALSYAIDAGGERLNLNSLRRVLEEVNHEVGDLVRTGWSIFHVFHTDDVAPSFIVDSRTGHEDDEFLECSFLRADGGRVKAYDMWRISSRGQATVIREFWEDNDVWARDGHIPGSAFSPNMMVRLLGELVRHARGLSERFSSPTDVVFRCEWFGLQGRSLYHPQAHWRHAVAKDGHRVSTGVWPVMALESDLPNIVFALFAPVARLFDIGDVITGQWVEGQIPLWKR